MAITAVTSTAVTGGSTSGNVTVSSPTGTTTGDVLVMCIGERFSSENVTAVDDGSGAHAFTKLRSGLQSSSASTSIWYRVVQAGDPSSWTVTCALGKIQVGLMAYRGVDNTTPIDAQGTTNTGSGGTETFNSVTTVTDGAMFVGVHANNGSTEPLLNAQTAGTPASATKRCDAGNGGTTSTRQGLAIVDGLVASHGATTAMTWSTNANPTWGTDTFALRPTSAPDTSIAGFNPYYSRLIGQTGGPNV